MSDEAAQPGDEVSQAIRKALAAGAAAGAEEVARRLAEAIGTGLDEIKAALQSAAIGASPRSVTVIGQTATATATAHPGTVQVTAALSGYGTLGSPRPAAAGLYGGGTLSVSVEDVTAAAGELAEAGRRDVEELASQPAAKWSKWQVALAFTFLVVAAYWLIPAEMRPYLNDMAGLAQGVEALLSMLGG